MNLQHMIPYANPTYFIWLMVGLLPMMLVLLFKQKRWQWYQTILTLAVLYVSFGGEYWQQGLALIGYVVYQTLLVYGYYQHRQRANTSGVFYGAVVAAILPLALSKVTPFFVGHASLIYFLGISVLLQSSKMNNTSLTLAIVYAGIPNNIFISVQTENPKRVPSFRFFLYNPRMASMPLIVVEAVRKLR